MTSLPLSFNEVKFNPVVQHSGQIFLTAGELAHALGYKSVKSVSNLYNSNKDEFSDSMTQIIELMTLENTEVTDSVTSKHTRNLRKKVRIFSLRGCHLIAVFARTDVSKTFRKWVLDILDKEVGQTVSKTHKSERTPLHEAHALLLAKTKHLNSSDAWKLIHQRFNVKHIDEIPYDVIPVAVEYVHHLIALYSKTDKQGSLFDKDTYELVRELTEAILEQNGVMNDIWKALILISKENMMHYSNFIIKSNTLARNVSLSLNFKSVQNLPLVDPYCKAINFYNGVILGVNPKWFNAQAW